MCFAAASQWCASGRLYRLNPAHTIRSGFMVSGESTQLTTNDSILPLDAAGVSPTGAPPLSVTDANSKLGWLLGLYVQDEWKITKQLTLNTGIRFDQMYQFVDANQFSPRVGLEYKPVPGTTIHAGYARYFTPPPQVIAGPTNLALFDNTPGGASNVQQPASCPPPHPVSCNSPVLPERSHYFDVGVTQKVLPGLEVAPTSITRSPVTCLTTDSLGKHVLTAFATIAPSTRASN